MDGSGGRRRKQTRITWAMLVLATIGVGSTGCIPIGWLGSNLTLNFNIPLGLNGNPGYYNPFGIVQAIVNRLLGVSGTGGGGGDAGLPGENGGSNVGGIL